MFARPNAQHCQVAYVTNDIDRAVAVFTEQYGAPGFFQFSTDQPGMPAGPRIKIALAKVGGVEIELIEPIGDSAPLFSDVLPGGDDLAIRFHHVAIRVDGSLADWEAHKASIDFARHPIVFSGELEDKLRYFYTDERGTMGHYVEHVWQSPELLAQMAAVTPSYPPAA
jgi:hypothetical protein